MGENIFEILEKGSVLASASVSIYDFVPVVKIINQKEENKTIYIKEDVKNKILDLGVSVKSEYKNYEIPEIIITKDLSEISLKIYDGGKSLGDDDGLIEFSSSNDKVTIDYSSSDVVKYGNTINIKISQTLSIGDNFSIEIKGKDDDDDFFKTSDKILIAGKLNFTVREFLTDIPNILLGNFDCTENCDPYDDEPPILVWEKGINSEILKEGIELFSKTSQGQYFLQLFQKKGDFYNKHSLMFIENDYYNNFAHTAYSFKPRIPDYKNLKFSEIYSNGTTVFLPQIEKNPQEYYMCIIIHLYINQFLKSQKENGWSHKRLIGSIAHTIGHEIFIHAYRKGFLSMEAWQDENFNELKTIYGRDTGDHGNVDHTDYITGKKDKGLSLMKEFQKELNNLLGNDLFSKIKKYHDKKYQHLKK